MSETWATRTVEALRLSSLPLDDDELARRLGASQRQTINQTCRRLQAIGVLTRYQGPDGKIVNALVTEEESAASRTSAPTRKAGGLLSEDEVKVAVKAHLENEGWRVQVAWGRDRGIDIEARLDDQRLLLEAKGEAANPPQQVNYFLGALGELVQRFTDAGARYGLALPDNAQFRGLVDRLPQLVRERLGLKIYFVDPGDKTTVRTVQ
jgi:hypothetical protein